LEICVQFFRNSARPIQRSRISIARVSRVEVAVTSSPSSSANTRQTSPRRVRGWPPVGRPLRSQKRRAPSRYPVDEPIVAERVHFQDPSASGVRHRVASRARPAFAVPQAQGSVVTQLMKTSTPSASTPATNHHVPGGNNSARHGRKRRGDSASS
jgi:hypothetical protein